MQTSLFIAKLLGPSFLIVGTALLSKPEAFRVLLQEFIKSGVLLYLAGILGLVGGLALLLTHSVWVLDWRLIITLLGWVTVVRAIGTIFLPQQVVSIGAKLIEHRSSFVIAAVFDLVIGAVLSYFGYLA